MQQPILLKQSFQNRLGEQLKAHRKEAGLRQSDVSRGAALSLPTLRNLEHGRGTLASWHPTLIALELELHGRQLPPAASSGQQIALLRQRRSLSQRTLCALIGCSQPTLIRLERDTTGRLETLERSLTVLGAGAYLTPRHSPKAFYTHAGTSSVHHHWRTPQGLLEQLYRVFTFDLDPCSPSSDPKKAPVTAAMHYTEKDDGLQLPWFGTVFVNPPYGKGLGEWIAKASHEATSQHAPTVVMLIPARPDTRYWHKHIAGKASVFFLRGRLKFGGSEQAAPFPSALVVWGASHQQTAQLSQVLESAWQV